MVKDKMKSFTEEFASENNLILDFSVKSLDDLEDWIMKNYPTIKALKGDQKILNLIRLQELLLLHAFQEKKENYISRILKNNIEGMNLSTGE